MAAVKLTAFKQYNRSFEISFQLYGIQRGVCLGSG